MFTRRTIRAIIAAVYLATVLAGLLVWHYAGPRLAISLSALSIAAVLMYPTKRPSRVNER